jgi:hypothetical protein
MRILFVTLFFLVGLSACATNRMDKITSTATTPLNDLNLVRTPIPDILLAAQKKPYGLPETPGCQVITDEIRKLDEVLGPDLDAAVDDANRGLIEQGGEAAGAAAVDALQRTAEGVIPFRSWIRKISGAEQYSKRVASAIAAGTARRAFLKGLRVAKGCA